MTIKEEMRALLMAMELNEVIIIPLHKKSSMVTEMADVRQYENREFKGRIDKTRGEYEIRRVR